MEKNLKLVKPRRINNWETTQIGLEIYQNETTRELVDRPEVEQT